MTAMRCWEEGDDESSALEEDALWPDSAAAYACQRWSDAGRWAGEEMPQAVIVFVRDEEGGLWRVEVGAEWELSWSAGAATVVS